MHARYMLVSVLLALPVLRTTPALAAAPTSEELRALPNQTRASADAALRTLRQFTPGEARELGFDDAAQLRQAALGPPMLDHLIQLDDLRNYTGGDPAALLRSTGQVEYPVIAQGQTRSSITLVRRATGWAPVSFGAPRLAVARSRQREALVARTPAGAASETFQVRIPALNVVFVAQEQNGTLMLTSLAALPDLGLQEGETLPAREMLLKLQPIARQIDPNVPR